MVLGMAFSPAAMVVIRFIWRFPTSSRNRYRRAIFWTFFTDLTSRSAVRPARPRVVFLRVRACRYVEGLAFQSLPRINRMAQHSAEYGTWYICEWHRPVFVSFRQFCCESALRVFLCRCVSSRRRIYEWVRRMFRNKSGAMVSLLVALTNRRGESGERLIDWTVVLLAAPSGFVFSRRRRCRNSRSGRRIAFLLRRLSWS